MKYPRTYHIEGSDGRRPGDKNTVAIEDLPSEGLFVIEEKLDGSEFSISFPDGNLQLTHRGSPVDMRSAEWSRFNEWLYEWDEDQDKQNRRVLQGLLGERYVMFGEWMYAHHTVFYNELTSYAYHYDVYDRETDTWMSTPRRREFLAPLHMPGVPVVSLAVKEHISVAFLQSLVQPSKFIHAPTCGEGLFVKAETADQTTGWFKFICPKFMASVKGGKHWKKGHWWHNRLKATVESSKSKSKGD